MSLDWSARYLTGETPWDKGEPHPELPFLLSEHRKIFAEAGSIFVPGCGLGHDAALIREVALGTIVALDIAPEAIKKAKALYPDLSIDWRVDDLFVQQGCFDVVFEHTCFCAIPIERRGEYADLMGRLIPQGGCLVGIFFPDPDHEGEDGPPFGIELDELHRFFEDRFELEWSQQPQKTYESRAGDGRELCMVWRRK